MQRASAKIDEVRAALAAAGDQSPLAAVRTMDLPLLLKLLQASGALSLAADGPGERLLYSITNQVLSEELIRRWDAGQLPPGVVFGGQLDLRPLTGEAYGLRCGLSVTSIRDEAVECRDLGGPVSVTNDAEAVCRWLFERFGPRRYVYVDSEGRRDELLHDQGRFIGFAPGPDGR